MNWIATLRVALASALLQRCLAVCCCVCLWSTTTVAAPPLWWEETFDLFDADQPVDDYSAANVGQLKNFAVEAYYQMLWIFLYEGGAGSEIEELIDSWWVADPSRDDFAALTAGQAKAIAKKYYDRLAALKAWPTDWQPWPQAATATTDDYAVINVGQLKNLFSFEILHPDEDFDTDGMRNGYEIFHGLDYRTDDSLGNPDNDGLSNIWEYRLKLDPHKADSDSNGTADAFEDFDLDGVANGAEITAGTDAADSCNGRDTSMESLNTGVDQQLVLKQAVAPVKFKMKVEWYNESTFENVEFEHLPVIFEVLSGSGRFEHIVGGTTGSRLVAFTDSDGIVEMNFRGGALKDKTRVRVWIQHVNEDADEVVSQEFSLYTSQCSVDADHDGMDDVWEAAIASAGGLGSIEAVSPVDDFDHDGVPNVFEFDRGTNPVDSGDLPPPDVVLDQTGTPHGAVPVVTTWNNALEKAAVDFGSYFEEKKDHPETRGIIKILPGSYVTDWAISRSALLWGKGNSWNGLPVLKTGEAVVNISLAGVTQNAVFVASGLVFDGDDLEYGSGLSVSGRWMQTRSLQAKVRLENCLIRNCPNYAFGISSAHASFIFTTITGCGVQGQSCSYLSGSDLDIKNSILWNDNTSQEIGASGICAITTLSSVVRGGAFNGAWIDPRLTPEGRPLPGSPILSQVPGSTTGHYPNVDIDGEHRKSPPHIGADQLPDLDIIVVSGPPVLSLILPFGAVPVP